LFIFFFLFLHLILLHLFYLLYPSLLHQINLIQFIILIGSILFFLFLYHNYYSYSNQQLILYLTQMEYIDYRTKIKIRIIIQLLLWILRMVHFHLHAMYIFNHLFKFHSLILSIKLINFIPIYFVSFIYIWFFQEVQEV
jgi:hypothetical protein